MEKYPQRLGIYRTYHEKYTTYWGDGSGRDSYAIVGNAGLRKPEAYVNTPPRTGFQQKERTTSTMYAGPARPYIGGGKDATVLRYFGDGSGRDGYVIKESGGAIPSYESTSPDKIFYSSLRQVNTEARKTIELDASGQKVKDCAQPWFRDQVQRMMKNQSQYQKNCSQRLSMPKAIRRRVVMSPKSPEATSQRGQLNDFLQSDIKDSMPATTVATSHNQGFFDKMVEQRKSVKTNQEIRRDVKDLASRFKHQRAVSQLAGSRGSKRNHTTIDHQAATQPIVGEHLAHGYIHYQGQRPSTTLERRRLSQKSSFGQRKLSTASNRNRTECTLLPI